MRFFVTYDADETAGLETFLRFLNESGFRKYFLERSYDDAETNVCVVLMCRQPYHSFKQRIRLSKNDNTLYVDLMLELAEMASMPATEKISFNTQKMLVELPSVISKYRHLDFDVLRFSRDLRGWFEYRGVVTDTLSLDLIFAKRLS